VQVTGRRPADPARADHRPAEPPAHRASTVTGSSSQAAHSGSEKSGSCGFSTENYLGGPASLADGYAMPANAVLEGLCPVVLLNSEYDDLRASAEAFAGQLAVAGVDVLKVLVRGMLHGFLNLHPGIEPVDRALDLMADVVAGTSLPAPR
jgi:acetyl esterase/lipase